MTELNNNSPLPLYTQLEEILVEPVFRRSTRKIPPFPNARLFRRFHQTSIFPIFTGNF